MMQAGGVFLAKKTHASRWWKNECVFQKHSGRGEKEYDPTIYPPWIFFQMCWSKPEGSSKSLAYGILDNLPAPFNGETFRSHQL